MLVKIYTNKGNGYKVLGLEKPRSENIEEELKLSDRGKTVHVKILIWSDLFIAQSLFEKSTPLKRRLRMKFISIHS